LGRKVGCRQIIFTSSVSPYGPTDSAKTEDSIPTPATAYGSSKLAAEKIHIGWQRVAGGRRLVIVRPGVVFGPGEDGNVTRLIRALLKGYFFYAGNWSTRKAGGYIKELLNTLFWALDRIPDSGGICLYNFTMPDPPTVEDYVNTICHVAGVKRSVRTLPYPLLLAASYLIEDIARLFGFNQPISPVRARKLIHSNNIEPAVLKRGGYQFQFTLETAMQDWIKDRPDDW